MDLLRLEQQRQALEQSLQSLKASLKHWQIWEAEYEGLKEEIEAAGPDVDAAALARISTAYDGELVTEREVRDLTGLAQQARRTGQQIVGVISRRQEYVQKNIETVQRRFWDAEAKLEELDFAAFSAASRSGGGGNAAGFPLTEIHEELDDDDNVISSRTSHPESNTAQLVDSLRKAGLADDDFSALPEAESADHPAVRSSNSVRTSSSRHTDNPAGDDAVSAGESSQDENGPERPPIRKKSVSFTADTKSAVEPVRVGSEDGRKSVSFAEKVAVAPAAAIPEFRSVSFSPKIEEIPAQASSSTLPQAANDAEMQKTLRAHFKPGDKVYEINDDDEVAATHIVMPENESPEDAQMRREMLEYHLNEVGHVVAQIDLDENYADYDDENEDDDYADVDDTTSASDFAPSEHLDEDTPYTSGGSDSESDDEDQYGRSQRRVLSDEYHKEMQELERRLIGNLGPAPSNNDIEAADADLDPQDVHRLVVRQKRSSISSTSSDGDKKPSGKKRVSFAQVLDVAEPSSSSANTATSQEAETAADPVKEAVMERTTAMSHSLPQPQPASLQKPSRFKQQARAVPSSDSFGTTNDSDDNDHSGPPGKIIADQLIERPTVAEHNAPPSADEPDPIMQRRQLAADYYRRRNELIRQQGGFKQDPADEDAGTELMEERDGKLKKVSRFKAARIRP